MIYHFLYLSVSYYCFPSSLLSYWLVYSNYFKCSLWVMLSTPTVLHSFHFNFKELREMKQYVAIDWHSYADSWLLLGKMEWLLLVSAKEYSSLCIWMYHYSFSALAYVWYEPNSYRISVTSEISQDGYFFSCCSLFLQFTYWNSEKSTISTQPQSSYILQELESSFIFVLILFI